MAKGVNVAQQIKGRSLRSFRFTKTYRAANRYLIYSDEKLNKYGFPKNLNDTRAYIYTLSVALQDAQAIIPAPIFSKINNVNLKVGRTIGDFNAIRNSLVGNVDNGEVAGIGERFIRRFGGRQIGKGMRVIPSGDTYFGNAVARSFRSVLGANATIELDRFIKSMKPDTVAAQMVADIPKVAKKGQLKLPYFLKIMHESLKQKTPVDTGALFQSIYAVRKGDNDDKHIDYLEVGIGNVSPMPDPRVPYPHIVEFGINAGFEKDLAPHIKARFPTPARFNYLRSVSGPVPDAKYYTDYSQDNRGPFEKFNKTKRTKNVGKGAMVRRTANYLVNLGNKTPNFDVFDAMGNPFQHTYKNASKNVQKWDLPF